VGSAERGRAADAPPSNSSILHIKNTPFFVVLQIVFSYLDTKEKQWEFFELLF